MPGGRARPEEPVTPPEARFVTLWSHNIKTSTVNDDEASEGNVKENDEDVEDSAGNRKSLEYRVGAIAFEQPAGVLAAIVHAEANGRFGNLNCEIEAEYIVSFEPRTITSLKLQENTILGAVRAAVWPRFRDLFALSVAQTNFPFPPLPREPAKVDFSTPEDDEEVESRPKRRRKRSA